MSQVFEALRGPAKVQALMCGRSVTRVRVAKLAGAWPMDVTRELNGEGDPRPLVRNALSAVLEVPLEEIEAALAEAGRA
jgi:hypothetical protein